MKGKKDIFGFNLTPDPSPKERGDETETRRCGNVSIG